MRGHSSYVHSLEDFSESIQVLLPAVGPLSTVKCLTAFADMCYIGMAEARCKYAVVGLSQRSNFRAQLVDPDERVVKILAMLGEKTSDVLRDNGNAVHLSKPGRHST